MTGKWNTEPYGSPVIEIDGYTLEGDSSGTTCPRLLTDMLFSGNSVSPSCPWTLLQSTLPLCLRLEKIPWEGEFTLRSDPWAGLIASSSSRISSKDERTLITVDSSGIETQCSWFIRKNSFLDHSWLRLLAGRVTLGSKIETFVSDSGARRWDLGWECGTDAVTKWKVTVNRRF